MASLDECSRYRLLRSYDLQLAYEKSIRRVEVVIGEEDSRRLRLRILLQEEENDDLREQIAVADDRISHLEQECTVYRAQIDCVEADSHHKSDKLCMKVRELSNVKAELVSMSAVSMDSTKLLTEKLSLARELATLKPELEHLRSQTTYQQTILAEKLALQRRVSTLEVELQAEKRSVMRVATKDKIYENAEVLQSQIHELQTELSKERRERENLQRLGERETSEWKSQRAVFEKRVEQLKAKLRESKTRVKLLQDDLVQAIAVRRKSSELSPRTNQTTQNSRKRTAVEMSIDKAIGTPDGFSTRGRQLMEKKGKRDRSLLGEKSTFSITPYLNRTICVGPESRQNFPEPKTLGEQSLSAELPTLSKDEGLPVVVEDTTASGRHEEGLCKQNILTNSKSMIMNRKVPYKGECVVDALRKLTEESDENADQTRTIDSAGRTPCSIDNPASVAKEKEPQKKRRKLLGATKMHFDDEDGSASKKPLRVLLGPTRSFAKGGLSGGNISLGAEVQRNSAALRAFSPLKRDKKSLQASFLV